MKKIIILINVLVISILSNAQNYSIGLLRNAELAERVPQKAELLTRDYTIIPSSYSLQKYCPTPMNQEQYGTCTAWSSAYAARTIAEAVAYGWTDKETINREVFSPWYIYSNIKFRDDIYCTKGSYIESAVDFMKTKGVVKMRDYDDKCSPYPPQLSQAYQYRIDNYAALFNTDPDKNMSLSQLDMSKVKKAIANNRPVVIAEKCYSSLSSATDKWNGVSDYFRGYHAMCVVAYDDNKYGGAFLIQNSWGTNWGNGGFTWFTYNDFARAVYQAFEITVLPKSYSTKANSLSGSLKLQLSTGEEMRGSLSGGIYKISGEYISGTRYRIYVSNNQPAYVYVIGSDLQNNVSKVFPPNDRISPALTYKSNNIAIPDENWFIEMDNTVGKDYLCVLYSAEELDINGIVNRIRNAYGSFYDKVKSVLGDKLVQNSEINFSQNNIGFSAQSNRKVVALIAEVVHK